MSGAIAGAAGCLYVLAYRGVPFGGFSPDLSLQSYYDQTHRSAPIVAFYLNTLELAPPGTLQDDLRTFDTDFQHRFALGGRNRIVWGFGYRFTHDVVWDAPAVGLVPAVLDQNLFSAFLQDEILLTDKLKLTIGSKLEHNDFTGLEYEPSARLAWTTAQATLLISALWLLTRYLPMQRAKEIIYSGRFVSGAEARDLNLALYALPAAEVMDKAMELARSFAEAPTIGT